MSKNIKYKPNPNLPLADAFGIRIDFRHSSSFVEMNDPDIEGSHIHDCCEIYMNITGNVAFMTENTLCSVGKGDVIVTRDNEFHHCIYNESSVHDHYCLWVWAENCRELFSCFYDRPCGTCNLISLPPQEKEYLISLFAAMEQSLSGGRKTQRLAIFWQIIDFLNAVNSHVAENPVLIPPVLAEILAFMNKNFADAVSMRDLADRFYISQCTLERYFRQYLQTTPKRYYETLRLSNARCLLSEGNNVLEACTASGFADYSHFIALFRKRFGETPLKYKQKCEKYCQPPKDK